MARLFRPHIPVSVRVAVATRAFLAQGWLLPYRPPGESDTRWLRKALTALSVHLCGPLHLDHDPALVNRTRRTVAGKTVYSPDANDPRFLVYRTKVDHDIKTRVRGEGAKRSDLSQARYLKNVAKNRRAKKSHKNPTLRKIAKRPSKYNRKYNWPSRPLRSAKRWPTRRLP